MQYILNYIHCKHFSYAIRKNFTNLLQLLNRCKNYYVGEIECTDNPLTHNTTSGTRGVF